MGELLLVLLLLAGLSGQRGVRPGTADVPTGKPRAQLPPPDVARPPGNPFGRNCQAGEYNVEAWPTRGSILNAFEELGYETPTDRDTMNALGADQMLGGGDDEASPEVQRFQTHYNVVSGKGLIGPDAGGLAMDGFVGPCTLNALELVTDRLTGAEWRELLGVS